LLYVHALITEAESLQYSENHSTLADLITSKDFIFSAAVKAFGLRQQPHTLLGP